MARIKGTELSARHIDVIKQIIRRLDVRDIRELSRLISENDKGEKEDLIGRIIEKLNSDIELTQEQIDFLYKYAFCRSLFDILDSEFLQRYSSEIANEIGIPEFEILVLLSNKTESLRRVIGTVHIINDENRKKEFRENFSRILKRNIIDPLHLEIGGNLRINEVIEINNLRQQIVILQQELESLKISYEQKLQDKGNKITELNNSITILENEKQQLKNQIQIIAVEKQNLKTIYDALNQQFENRVEEEARRKFVENLRAWFPAAFNVENEAQQNVTDLVDYAKQVLKRQKDRDSNFGNRKALLLRIGELERVKVELEDAQQNAINPLPELNIAIQKIENEINRIKSLLGIKTEWNEIQKMLYGMANSVSDFDEYDQIIRISKFFESKQIIDNNLVKKIWDLVYSKYIYNAQLQPAENSIRTFGLRKSLLDNSDCLIICDAHNIIFHDVLRGKLLSQVQEQSRNNLIELIKKLAAGRDRVKFNIVFDGSLPCEENIVPNVKIVFSGGVGEHRADIKIIEIVKMNPDANIFVVSDDEEVAREVVRYHAIHVRVIMFICLLREFGALPPTFM